MSKFTDLLNTKRGRRVILAEISAYNKLTNTLETLRFSSDKFVTGPTDAVPSTSYRRRLSNMLQFQQSMYSSGAIGGRTEPGFGYIELLNQDGKLDYLRNYGFDGRNIILKMGDPTFKYADFGVVFTGTVSSISFSTSSIQINLRDFQHLLEQPLFANFYGGTGGWDGTADVKGFPIPHCYGIVRNVRPRVVDSTQLLYQVHFRSVQSINNVRDKGVPLTFQTDYATPALLLAASVTSGNYSTCLASGVFKLGGPPAGIVTCDCQGDNVGTYVSSTADLIQRITLVNSDITLDMLDTASFAALNTLTSAALGCYYSDGNINVIDVLDPIANSTGAFFGFARTGLMTVGRLDAPAMPISASYSPTDILETVERSSTAVPVWQLRLNYRRNWSPLSESDLATSFYPGGANAALMNNFTMEYRTTAPVNDTAVLTAHLLARDVTYDTLFDSESDANAEAARRLALEKVQRDLYKVPVKSKLFDRKINDIVEIKLGRYGLDSGRMFVLTGIDENLITSNSTLELWG